jgi:putative addiction module component (TIGR02574 family)
MLSSFPMTNFDRILAEAKALLTEEEQRRLSLALAPDETNDQDEIEAAWMNEARRRMADLDAGRTKAVPWSEVRERLFAKP